MIAGLDAPDAALGQVINLGTNHEIAIGDLALLIGEVMGKPVQIETQEERLRPERSEVERLLSNNTKARELLNWSPALAGRDGLREGLAKTAAWFTKPENLGR